LLSVRTTVVVAVENVLTRVQSFLYDLPGNVLAAVVGHPSASHVVRRPRRRTLTGVIGMGGFALVYVSIMRTPFATPTWAGHPVQRLSEGVADRSTVRGRKQWFPAVFVGHVVTVVLDVVLEIGRT